MVAGAEAGMARGELQGALSSLQVRTSSVLSSLSWLQEAVNDLVLRVRV